MAESKSDMSDVETTAVDIIRDWVLNDAQFYGRSDDEFLVIFLRGCKFNIEKTKAKLKRYYENRKNYPEWWGQRDLKSETFVALSKLRFAILLRSTSREPAIMFSFSSRVEESVCSFNDYIKYIVAILEVDLRDESFQRHGAVWIIDCKVIPSWFATKLLMPLVLFRLYNTLYKSMPIRLKGIHVLNANTVAWTVWKVIKPIMSSKLRKRVFMYKSDWSSMFDHVPIDLIPEEYGGNAGPMKQHEDEYIDRVASYTEYFLEDNIYGIRS